MEVKTDLDAICRSCMTTISSAKIDLLKTSQLVELYIRLSSTHLDNEDPLPKSICSPCYDRLHDFESFQAMCLESYKCLLSKYPKLDLKEEEVQTSVKEEESEISFSEELRQQSEEFALNGSDNDVNENDSDVDDVDFVDPLNDDLANVLLANVDKKLVEDAQLKTSAGNPTDSDDELLITLVKKKRGRPRKKPEIKLESDQLEAKTSDASDGILPDNITESKANATSEQFKCNKCKKIFIKKQRYIAHMRMHEGLKPYACSICPKAYGKEIRLNNHMRSMHTANPIMHPCTFEGCEKQYKIRESLTAHINTIHLNSPNIVVKERKPSTKPFACNRCPKTFFKQFRYDAHMRTHEGLKAFPCTLCNKQYSKYNRFKMHMKTDHSDNPDQYFCEYEDCNKVYKLKETLLQHIKIIHLNIRKPENRRTYVCELCGKVLSTIAVLKEHELIHKGEYPFKCNLCPSKFRASHRLQVHMLRHKGIKKFECEICGMKKTTQAEVRNHMNVHTREKQYPCTMCKSNFLNGGNLARHMRIVHNGERSFHCPHCDEAFGKAETLKYHVMRHTGEKPHECPICGKTFIQKHACKLHIQRHQKNRRGGTNDSNASVLE